MLYNMLALLVVVSLWFAPRWAIVPAFTGLTIFGYSLEDLNDLGRENYRALEEQREGSETSA
jgi:hypothetical protein